MHLNQKHHYEAMMMLLSFKNMPQFFPLKKLSNKDQLLATTVVITQYRFPLRENQDPGEMSDYMTGDG